jgi:hypothetical protein
MILNGFDNILKIIFFIFLFSSFLIQALLFKTNVLILKILEFAIFIAIAHQLLCHQSIKLSTFNSLKKFVTTFAYSSKSNT